MKPDTLILIGAGGHANACIDVIEQDARYQIAGLVGMQEEMHSLRLDYPVIGTDSDLAELAKQYQYALITVGQIRTPDKRMELYRQACELGFQLPVFVSPFAHVSRHATIGAGSIVMHGAIVNAGARVGENCIINSRALVEHDASLADHCHLSTGAILNGHASIGAGSFVGSGSIIKEGLRIGSGCVVGMGVFVRHHQADGTCVVG